MIETFEAKLHAIKPITHRESIVIKDKVRGVLPVEVQAREEPLPHSKTQGRARRTGRKETVVGLMMKQFTIDQPFQEKVMRIEHVIGIASQRRALDFDLLEMVRSFANVKHAHYPVRFAPVKLLREGFFRSARSKRDMFLQNQSQCPF